MIFKFSTSNLVCANFHFEVFKPICKQIEKQNTYYRQGVLVAFLTNHFNNVESERQKIYFL